MKIDFSPSLSFSFLLLFPPLQDYYYYYNTSFLVTPTCDRKKEKRRGVVDVATSAKRGNVRNIAAQLYTHIRIYI